MDNPQIISVRKIWDEAPHSAFTDLVRFQNKWLCVFREAGSHVGGNGTVRLIESADGETWKSLAVFTEQGIDLRDPKLSIAPGNRLMLLVEGVKYSDKGEYISRQPQTAFSSDGAEWTDFIKILEPHEWLWRVTWHEERAYGVSYRALPGQKEWTAALFASGDGLHYQKITPLDVTGYPSEAALRFSDSGEMIALIRRGGRPSQNAWIGKSESPYKKWDWKDADQPLGGPDFIILPDGSMWAAGRIIEKNSEGRSIDKVVLARMNLDGIEKTWELPSGGNDAGYPGIASHDGLLWISYYSSHEGKSAIYLAKIKPLTGN